MKQNSPENPSDTLGNLNDIPSDDTSSDKSLDLEGIQPETPSDKSLNLGGIQHETPSDKTLNLEGIQPETPSDKVLDLERGAVLFDSEPFIHVLMKNR